MGGLKWIVIRQKEAAYREEQNFPVAYGFDVHANVRVANVPGIERSSVADALHGYALQSHFDFLVCNESKAG